MAGGADGPASTDDDWERAREIVLRRLSVQARSRSELRSSLRQAAIPPEIAEAVLDRMDEVGLVDDAAFAESWVRSRQQRKQLSARALRQELQRKGIDRDTVEASVAEVDADAELEAAIGLAERKARSMSTLDPAVRRRRLAAALARRGFGHDIVRSALATALAEDLDGQSEI